MFFFIFITTPEGHVRVHFANLNLISVRHRKYRLIILVLALAQLLFNIGLALLLGIRSLDPRSRARTAPALTWCRRQLWSQTSCSAKSRSQYWSLTFNDKHWNVWWNLASLNDILWESRMPLLARGPGFGIKMLSVLLAYWWRFVSMICTAIFKRFASSSRLSSIFRKKQAL